MKHRNEDKDATLFQIIVDDYNDFGNVQFYIKNDVNPDEAIKKLKEVGKFISDFSKQIVNDYFSRNDDETKLPNNKTYLH